MVMTSAVRKGKSQGRKGGSRRKKKEYEDEKCPLFAHFNPAHLLQTSIKALCCGLESWLASVHSYRFFSFVCIVFHLMSSGGEENLGGE